jgi:hypothetical protein
MVSQAPMTIVPYNLPDIVPESWCQREETVNALYDALIREKLVQVCDLIFRV